jgi:imidazolonepropionase-like amidohydrolase
LIPAGVVVHAGRLLDRQGQAPARRKRANLIAVSGDPLEDVTVLKQVEFVMKDGRTVKAPTG